jgi:glycosyltransferase involved in cell wall biosynthesis
LFATTIEFGGIEQVLLSLVRHLDADVDFVPVLFTRRNTVGNSFISTLRDRGLPVETIIVDGSSAKYFNPLRNIKDAVSVLRKCRVDLVHAHGYRADVIALIAARAFRLPVVSTCHGFIANDSRQSLYNRLDMFLLRYFTRVIAVSTPMRDELIARGVNSGRVDVIANAVEVVGVAGASQKRRQMRTRLGFGDRDFVFGFVGRLSDEKGVGHLVQATKRVIAEHESSRVLIVGAGPARESLEAAVGALGLASRVHFAGFQADTSDWYAAMDAFVLPSLTEGTPMALLEAMSHRLPVIATSVGGVPSVVSHLQNGVLVPPGDPIGLCDAMGLVVGDGALRARLRDNAVRAVREKFGVHMWAEKMRATYLSACQGTV